MIPRKLVIYWRPSPSESWRLGHHFLPGTSEELAIAHIDALIMLLSHVGCPDAEARLSHTLL